MNHRIEGRKCQLVSNETDRQIDRQTDAAKKNKRRIRGEGVGRVIEPHCPLLYPCPQSSDTSS